MPLPLWFDDYVFGRAFVFASKVVYLATELCFRGLDVVFFSFGIAIVSTNAVQV